VIQAYLYRSEQDVQDCWHTDAAYGCARERTKSHRNSRSEEQEVDAITFKLIRCCCPAGSITDRDARSENDCGNDSLRVRKEISKSDFEFQMLYGVRTDLSGNWCMTDIACVFYIRMDRTGFRIS